MAANLTPQYREAEARFRAAQDADERLAALEEMWRELPKHKSTEKIQADLKKKLSAVRKECQQVERHGGGRVDLYAIPRSGAGQVALLGPPNSGKSSLVAALTHAHVRVADFPFSTSVPVPGMVPYLDVQIQLVDTPPITADHVPTGMAGLWRSADALVVVADLSTDACAEDTAMCLAHLASRHVELTDGPRRLPEAAGQMLRVPGLILAAKDDADGAPERLEFLREVTGLGQRIEPLSTRDPARMARFPRRLWELLGVIRVYAKPPGRKPDLHEPFILREGADVAALAARVFRGKDHAVHSARIWGHGVADGQHVQLHHPLHDGDVVELHS